MLDALQQHSVHFPGAVVAFGQLVARSANMDVRCPQRAGFTTAGFSVPVPVAAASRRRTGDDRRRRIPPTTTSTTGCDVDVCLFSVIAEDLLEVFGDSENLSRHQKISLVHPNACLPPGSPHNRS